MKKKISIYWLVPTILLSSVFGFFTTSYSYFNFKKEVDILQLLSLIFTTSIGFYIASSLQKNIEVRKFEKELIFDTINKLKTNINVSFV